MPAVTGGRRWVCACRDRRTAVGLCLRVPADTAESLCSAYTYETYHMIFSANAFARGQEGEDHARREVFPLLTPLSLGFVSASGMEFVRTSLLLGAAIALSA